MPLGTKIIIASFLPQSLSSCQNALCLLMNASLPLAGGHSSWEGRPSWVPCPGATLWGTCHGQRAGGDRGSPGLRTARPRCRQSAAPRGLDACWEHRTEHRTPGRDSGETGADVRCGGERSHQHHTRTCVTHALHTVVPTGPASAPHTLSSLPQRCGKGPEPREGCPATSRKRETPVRQL